jgi:hypothetical protein
MKNPVTANQPETLVLLPDQPEERLVEGPQFERPQAPSRLLCSPRSLGAVPSGEHPLDALTLFAAIKRAYLPNEQQSGPHALLECQEVPPQAVSLRCPPEQAWLLRLVWGNRGENGCPAEALVFLQEHELQLIWR